MVSATDAPVFSAIEEGIPTQWKAYDLNDAFEGYYLETETIEDEGAFTGKPWLVHMFRGYADGLLYSISGSYVLNRGLAKVTKGQLVRVTFTGTTDMGTGKNPAKNYRIEVSDLVWKG